MVQGLNRPHDTYTTCVCAIVHTIMYIILWSFLCMDSAYANEAFGK